MNLETVDPVDLGQSLSGYGLNLLVPDVPAFARVLGAVLGLPIYRVGRDFALIAHGSQLLQIHSDAAFANHPVGHRAGRAEPRGTGVQIYLFGLDPDGVAKRASEPGAGARVTLIEPPADKPHGLREATVMTREGYAFTAARPTPRTPA